MSALAVSAPREEVTDRRDTTPADHVLAPAGSCPVGFVAGLRAHGDRTAVMTDSGELSYRELADRVDRMAVELGTRRRLVLVEAAGDLATLVGYLGALRGGHVALLAARSDDAQRADLTATFDPDAVIGADGTVRDRRPGSRHDLHPELALLMTTSGSTGAPRLVRLPAAALDANAAAIAEYLQISPTDRAAVMLPMHYCYGLSVVHSNLLRGAALVLTDRSVSDPQFWATFREQRATSLHGVPYTFELLDRVGFAEMSLPHLRYVTQAGGRLAPEQVGRWARLGRRDGWRLYVMYGQTEATARMAYLPPEQAESAPGAIGRPIPGGSFTLDPVDGSGPGVGEVVYRGPNVMLGYAKIPGDLALGRTVHDLRTGDLGRRRDDGLYEIVGRRSRFLKPLGVRIDLDGLEGLLAENGVRAACTGIDEQLLVAVETGSEEQVRSLVSDRLHLPAHALSVAVVGELPRRPNGKLDHPAAAELVAVRSTPEPRRRWWARQRPRTIREVFARTFGQHALADDASFVDLGGDSLTYVQVATEIEEALGRLPQGWDRMPLGELAAMTPRRSRLATLESAVVLRALAIVFVIGDHAHLWTMLGGAHLLLAVSGWTFARFVLADRSPGPAVPSGTGEGSVSRRILRSTARIAIPSALWIGYRALVHNVRFIDALLVGSLLPPIVRGYWYIDALVQTLVLLAMLFAVPLVRRLDRRFPFGMPATLLAVTCLGRLFPVGYADWFTIDIYSTQVVAWLFVLGWMIQRVHTRAQTRAGLAAVLVLVPTFFGADLERSVMVTIGAVVLLLVPRISLPRSLARPVTTMASASLGIFLTHFALLPLENVGVPAWVLVPLALVAGVASWSAVTAAGRAIPTWRIARRTATAAGDPPDRRRRLETRRPVTAAADRPTAAVPAGRAAA